MPSTNKPCVWKEQRGDRRFHCIDQGQTQCAGYCPTHWLNLTEAERKILRDPEVIERVRTIYPARSRLSTVALWVWRLIIAAGLAHSVYWHHIAR